MKRYTDRYMFSHDIDWFFVYGDKPIHAASFSGKIPREITCEMNREMQSFVEQMEINVEQAEIEISKDILDELESVSLSQRQAYLHSFIEMARKGFYSFDRIIKYDENGAPIFSDDETNTYRLIASPKTPFSGVGNLISLDNVVHFSNDGTTFSFNVESNK